MVEVGGSSPLSPTTLRGADSYGSAPFFYARPSFAAKIVLAISGACNAGMDAVTNHIPADVTMKFIRTEAE